MVDLMVVLILMVVLSEIKYERSSSFLAKSFLTKILLSKIELLNLYAGVALRWLPLDLSHDGL